MSSVEELAKAVVAGERTAVGRAITLVESTNPEHRAKAAELLSALAPETGGAIRIGITGVPGVGKSTFVDALGTRLTSSGHRVGVLAVDPSSSVNQGSVMGDKTRMPRLANDPSAFVRPSPSSGALGGVTRTTRETLSVLEAAGYDVVLVETVGVGQSETVVSDMVDMFVVLALPGAGDELQGIKKGVLELADLVIVNKADGDQAAAAARAAVDLEAALRIVTPPNAEWHPPVMTVSALHEEGLDLVWGQVTRYHDQATETGELANKRGSQQVAWMWSLAEQEVIARFKAGLTIDVDQLAAEVRSGAISPTEAAERLLGDAD